MNLSLIAKLAMAGVVLTGITGTSIVGNVAGVNQEAKAQVANPNAKYFNVNVGGKNISFEDTFNKDKLSPKILSDEIKKKLDENGLESSSFNFSFEVKTKARATIKGGGQVGATEENQAAEFNPNTDTLQKFEITNN